MQKISDHITYNECIHSDVAKRYGIKNYFSLDQLERMKLLAEKVFEPLRNYFNVPIFISSFFRSLQLNKLIGGAVKSQHLANNGAAIDLDAQVYDLITNRQIFIYIKDNLEFDQLVWEFGDLNEPAWVHVSYNEIRNRKQILRSYRSGGVTFYEEYNMI